MPHFTIEASSGTNPMTEELVYQTLERASGKTPHLIREATQQLSNWETTAGYYSALQDVYANLHYHLNIRFQAIIQLKNGIDKYWRKTSSYVISKQEKLKIRTKAIEAGIQEPIPQLGLQNALMLAKIVRYEFPHDWPDVITALIRRLRQHPQTTQHLLNVINLTHQIIKELATARLQRSKTSLRQAAPELFQVLGTLYVAHAERWIAYLQGVAGDENGGTSFAESLMITYGALKAIRRLIISGFEHPHRNTDVEHFWDILQKQLGQIWAIAHAIPSGTDGATYDLVSKHLLQLSKLHLEMAQIHPAAFVMLPGCINLLRSYWDLVKALGKTYAGEMSAQDWKVKEAGDTDKETSLLEKLALKGLLLFRSAVKLAYNPTQTFKYQHAEDKEERKKSIHLIKSEVLVDSFILEALEVLVTQFFVLRPTDLREWEEEPTEWEKREEELTEAWEFSLRSCSEKLFLDLMINFKELLVPRLLQVFHLYASPDNDEVFLKDSLYTSVGLAAAVLTDKFDFNDFLKSTLLPEVQLTRPNYNLLRRRIAILLGQWTPVIPETIDKPTVYHVFALLLSPQELNDQVVRVTAGRQLRPVLEPFEFSYNDFSSYATPIFQNLMALIRETELTETKMALLETVRVAAQRMEAHIAPFSDEIMNMLPRLWEASSEEHLMKQAILTVISALITSLTKQSLKYHPQILPLIRDSVQPDSDTRLYLLEEALDLWSAVIQQTPSTEPSPSSALLSLCSCLLSLVELGSDSLRQTLDIVESYMLLSPTTTLPSSFLRPLLANLSLLIGSKGNGLNSSRREITRTTQLIETLIKTLSVPRHFDDKALQLQAGQHFISIAIDTSFLQNFLSLLKETYDYHQDPRPARSGPAIIGPGETDLFSVLARIALLSPNLLLEAVNAANGPATAAWLVTEWIMHYDNIGDVYRKKLHVLALTSLLCTTNPPPQFMLEQLQSLMTIWTDLIIELGEDAPAETKGDYLWQPTPDESTGPQSEWAELNEAPEEERKRELSRIDPIHRVHIREFVAETMRSVILGVGGWTNFDRDWLSVMDKAVVNAFGALNLI
jgi:Importin-beta N-terminal domain/Exportin 1-like protein